MADPLGIVTLAQFKTSIRAIGDDPAHDELMQVAITAGVDWVAEVTGIDLKADSYAADDVPEPLRTAIVLVAKAVYDGDMTWPAHPAVNHLLAPYRTLSA